jgi:hypothetical protein
MSSYEKRQPLADWKKYAPIESEKKPDTGDLANK